MSDYLTPGVFIENIKTVNQMPIGTDPVSAFVGIATTGELGVPTLINSWTEYLTIFATGQESAFLPNSNLAYAVYGFFQNGGKKCYVTRVAKGTVSGDTVTFTGSAKALSTDPSSGASGVFAGLFSAKYEGDWANTNLRVLIEKDGYDSRLNIFRLKVIYNGEVVESWGNLKPTVNTTGCFADVINSESNFIQVVNRNVSISARLSSMTADIVIAFSGGAVNYGNPQAEENPEQPITTAVYEAVLKYFDEYEEIRLVSIPNCYVQADIVALANYCSQDGSYKIAICEGFETSTQSEITQLRAALNGTNAILYYPWITVVNPISSNGSNINIPACGHICGVFARIADSRGFWKAAAGTEANIRGAVGTAMKLTRGQTDILNPKGINCILPKTNYGIVIWGARSCDGEFNYSSGLYTNLTIKRALYELTQPLVFEPHDSVLWTKAKTICQAYLNDMFQRGAFFGEQSSDAFYVKCDEELNPASVRNAGKLIIEVGYAEKKPAEFVIIRIAHELTNA